METQTGTWTVRRCWLPKRKILDVFDDGIFAVIVLMIAAAIFLALAVFFVIPLLLIEFDVLALVLLCLLGTGARVVLHRPWEIEAVGPDETRLAWRVVGWNRSRRTIAEVSDRLRRGELLTASTPGLPPT